LLDTEAVRARRPPGFRNNSDTTSLVPDNDWGTP
jgi:hypothetical protein